MAQHDMNIANQGFPATRADLNNALQALVSNSSGASAPTTTFANQFWYDTNNEKFYMRNETNNAWILLFELDQTNNEWMLSTGVVQARDSDGLALKTDDGTTRLFIKDSDGAIGIGTTSPTGALHVDKSVGGSPIATFHNLAGSTANDAGIEVETSTTGSWIQRWVNSGSEKARILAGGGLTFNGDTTASNALDDYEEGLHSPTLTGSTSGSVGMRSGYQQLSYQVVGNRCTMTGRWEVSGGHSLVGNVKISLPFATANLTDQAGVGVGTIFLHRTGTDFDQGVVFGLVAFEGESAAYIYYQPSGTVNEALVQGSQLDSNFEGFLNISYPLS